MKVAIDSTLFGKHLKINEQSQVNIRYIIKCSSMPKAHYILAIGPCR